MTTQLPRTSLVSLVAALVLAACATAQPGPAANLAAGDCHAEPEAARPQFVVGYGSLMQDESRRRTAPQAGPAHPIELAGFRRGWFARGDSLGASTTYLGAVPDSNGRLNAVVYRVDADELRATDRREASYCRAPVPLDAIRTLEGQRFDLSGGQAWIYVNGPASIAAPSARYPIVESYVDIFVSGCLEQEERFGLSGFARQCLASTSGWSEHWVNDRLYPRRPFIHQPRAHQIDTLLSQQLPDYFARMRFE